jgi:GNAT superfamily N-acetyltransferase
MTDERWVTVRYQDPDAEGLLELARLCFGETGAGDRAYFDWQYRQNPAGRPRIWLAREPGSGRIVGEYWLLPVRARVEGGEWLASLTVNAAVHPDYQRQGVFAALGVACCDDCPQQGIDFTYSITSPESHHGHMKYLGFEPIERIPLLVKPLDAGVLARYRFGETLGRVLGWAGGQAAAAFSRGRPVALPAGAVAKEIRQFDSRFDAFWMQIRDKYPVMIARDRAYLEWRYQQIPDRQYQTTIVEDSAGLVAYLVTRETEMRGVPCGMIVDLMAERSPRGQLAVEYLIAAAGRRFAEQHLAISGCLMLTHAEEYGALRRQGYRVLPHWLEPQSFPVSVRVHSKQMPATPVRHLSQWYFTMGDYDVI